MSKYKIILFRADSSSSIGTGHIMRDLVLAKQYPDAKIIFATKKLEGNINYKINEAGYKLEILQSSKFEEFDNLVQKHNVDMAIIDHYDIEYTFEQLLKEKNPQLTLMVLDDIYEKHYCDILLNHNISADKKRYKDLVPKHCKLLCGENYTLIRDEFIIEKAKKNRFFSKSKRTVFIAMGGSDHSNILLKLLLIFSKKFRLVVVTTRAYHHLYKLRYFTNTHKNIELHINAINIARLIKRADFAIVSPSVIAHEVAFMELPFLSIMTGEDQREIYNYLTKKKFLTMQRFDTKKMKRKIVKLSSSIKKYQLQLIRIRTDDRF